MIINNSEEIIINNYLKSNNEQKQEFVKNSEQIKNQISKNMAYRICEVVYDTKKCVVPNERDLQEKITNLMDEIIDDYYKEIDGYVRLQSETIYQITTRINDNELEFDQSLMLDTLMKPVNYSEIELEQELINKIIESVNTHIAFRNQINPEYYKLKKEIEDYVRQEIPNKMDLFKEELDKLYEEVLNKLNDIRQNFYGSVSSFNKKEQNISPNINETAKTLESNILFDSNEEYESENAKRFL